MKAIQWILNWFIARRERHSRRARLSRSGRVLYDEILTYGWQVAVCSLGISWAFFFGYQRMLSTWRVPFWVTLPIAILMVAFLGLVISNDANVLVRKHHERLLEGFSARRASLLRATYGRRPPVATLPCPTCKADVGLRHQPNCPAVPAGWFSSRHSARTVGR